MQDGLQSFIALPLTYATLMQAIEKYFRIFSKFSEDCSYNFFHLL